jgi:hypothetical protein
MKTIEDYDVTGILICLASTFLLTLICFSMLR